MKLSIGCCITGIIVGIVGAVMSGISGHKEAMLWAITSTIWAGAALLWCLGFFRIKNNG